MIFVEDQVRSMNLEAGQERSQDITDRQLECYFKMRKSAWEIEKFLGFAPNTGKNLEDAMNALSEEISN